MWICPNCNECNYMENTDCIECGASRFSKRYKRAAKMEGDIIERLRADRADTAKSGGRLKSSIDRHGTEKTSGAPRYCADCGCRIPGEARFCPECGAKI